MLSFVQFAVVFQIGMMEVGTEKSHLNGHGGNGGMTLMLAIMNQKKLRTTI